MDLKREASTGVAHLATVALTLRRLYQPDFEAPQAIQDFIRESLSGVDTADLSWQRIATVAKGVQSLNVGWSAEPARHVA